MCRLYDVVTYRPNERADDPKFCHFSRLALSIDWVLRATGLNYERMA